MLLNREIRIGDHNSGFAQATTCTVQAERTMFVYRFTFNFGIKALPREKGEPVVLLGWDVDLYYRDGVNSVLMGRMLPGLGEQPKEIRDELSLSRYFELRPDDFLQLVDKSHRGDVTFEFHATPRLAGITYPKQEQGVLVIPRSTWLEHLNRLGMDRYELISIRIPVASSHLHEPLVNALAKIREAESLYTRGDWNGAVSSCRSAWRTILSSAPSSDKAFEHLLAPVIGDPRRKEFAMALVKSLNDILNKAVHLEGDVKTGQPPAELNPEDALLCIHWYAAVTGYLSSLG